MKVRELMTTELETAQPDSTLEELAAMMKENDVGSIPIVDEDGELAGIVTDRDIVVRCIAEGKDPSEATAEEVMSSELETVEPDSDVSEAAEIMSRHQVRRLPVVENGELVGMIALGDIAVKQSQDSVSGDTLEKVSRGVRQESGSGFGKGRSGRVGSADTGASGAESGGTRASKPRGASREQGISNHAAQEEDPRQEKVASSRPEAAQKQPSGKRKAG